jgi:hypothetical protein
MLPPNRKSPINSKANAVPARATMLVTLHQGTFGIKARLAAGGGNDKGVSTTCFAD